MNECHSSVYEPRCSKIGSSKEIVDECKYTFMSASTTSLPQHSPLRLSFYIFTEEYDEYDREFDKMREATLKTRGVQAKEELGNATKHVEECRKHLDYAREQVGHITSLFCCAL